MSIASAVADQDVVQPNSTLPDREEKAAKRSMPDDDVNDAQEQDNATEHKKGRAESKSSSNIKVQMTFRNPQYTYFHLVLYALSSSITAPSNSSPSRIEQTMDVLTFRQNLSSAFTQFLGMTGSAIQVDVLQFIAPSSRDIAMEGADEDPPTNSERKHHAEAWIRVPRLDADAVQEALSTWTGRVGTQQGEDKWKWVVKGRDDWLARLAGSNGQDLFVD